jgi:hypothetical protein
MKAWIAILFTVSLVAACSVASVFLNFNFITWMVLSSSLWVAYDSSRIKLARYKSGISYGPIVLFIACALLWLIGFPWYLIMRHRIATGTAVLKDAAPVSESG